MKTNWSKKWKNCLIWFSSYVSFIAFALVGGYTIVKNDDEELKSTAKKSFIVCLIFACLSAFLSIFSNFAGMSDNYYSSKAYDFYDIFNRLVTIAEIVVYAVFIVWEFFKKEKSEPQKPADETDKAE